MGRRTRPLKLTTQGQILRPLGDSVCGPNLPSASVLYSLLASSLASLSVARKINSSVGSTFRLGTATILSE